MANPFDQFDAPAASGGNPFDQFDDKPKVKEPGLARSAADTALAGATGLVSGVQMLSNVAGADNPVSRGLGKANEFLADLESPYRKAEKQERAKKIKAAEESGSTWEEVKAYAGAFGEAPLDTTVNALGTSVPTLAAAFLTGGKSAAAQIAARAVPAAMGAAQGAGAVKGQIYEAVEQEHLKAGKSPEEAAARAAEAQAYDSKNAGQIGLGAVLGVLAGTTGAEAAVRRLIGGTVAKEAGKEAAMGIGKAAGLGVLKETPVEMLQGGQERVASNLALQNEGFDTPTWQGVAGQAALEGLASAPMGAGFGMLDARGLPTVNPNTAAEPPAQPPAPGAEQPPAPFVNPASLTGNNAAALLGGQGSGLTGAADPLRAVVTPSQAMGIDPNAGAISRVAAEAVDGPASMEMAVRQAERDMAALAAEDSPEAGADPLTPSADPLISQVAGYVAEMGTASPQMVAAKFGVTTQRAAELLAQADPTADDLFPPPQGAANVSNTDAAGALAAGVGGPVGVDAAGSGPDAGLLAPATGQRPAGTAGTPAPSVQESVATPVPGRDSDKALKKGPTQTKAKVGGLKELIARNKAAKSNVQDRPQGTAPAAAPAPAEAVQAPQAVGGDGAAQPGAAPAGNPGVEAAGVVPASTDATGKPASWMIRNKDTGEVVMETFDRAKVQALNTAKYEAVPAQEYLAGLSKKSPTPSPTTTEPTNGTQTSEAIPQETGREETALLSDSVSADTTDLRDQLRKVEDQILQAVPGYMAQGGGDIEAAMKSRKVPANLKMKRNAIKKKLQEQQAASPAPAAETATHGAALQSAMQAEGWTAEVDSPGNTIWVKRVGGEEYTARMTGASSMEVTVLVNGVGTQIGSTATTDPKAAAKAASKAVADDVADSAAPAPSQQAQAPAAQPAVAPPVPAAAPAPEPAAQADEFLPEGWTKSINGYTKRPVYRMEQGGGQPFAVVTQTEGMTYEVQIRHGDKQLTNSTQRGALSEVLAGAKAELAKMTQAASVTHQDPGEKPEAATKGVVNDSLKTAAKNEDTKPSEMRKWLLAEIDKELLQAPDRADYDEAVKRLGEKDAIAMYTGSGFLGKNTETGFITFDVPGDGKFKVRNSVRGLLEFRKTVNSSLGFKDSGQKPLKPEQNDGVQGGSGGQMAAITNMIEEGDFEAARDYAEAVGIKLEDVKVPRGERKPQWDTFLKDGTVPPPPDTRPMPAPKTADQLNAEKLEAVEAERRKPKDTGWNMAGTGYGGKRYTGRNITLADGREVVARIYENAGNYDEVEIKVDGVRKFTVRDSYNAQDKADAFIKTLTDDGAQVDYKGFERIAKGNGAFDLRDGNMTVSVEPTERGKFQASFRGAKSSPHLMGEQGAVDWAANYRDDGSKLDAEAKRFVVPDPPTWDYRLKRRGGSTYLIPPVGQAFTLETRRALRDWARGAGFSASIITDNEISVAAVTGGPSLDYIVDGVEDQKYERQAAKERAATQAATGTRRDPTKVSMFNPYNDGDIVTIDGQDWTVKADTPGWYLTTTGNWRGQHPTIRNVKAMADLIREVEQAAEAKPAPQANTPKLTQAEAKDLMEWQDLGQKDGIKTHILTFYESKADKDAKRGRMVVATVTKEADSKTWVVEGTDDRLAMLAMAKKKAEDAGMARAVADGFVEPAAAESDYASTAEQVEAAKELLLPIRQGETVSEEDRQTLESLLKIPSLKGFDQPTARRLLMIAGATKAAIEKVMRTNPVSIDDLATELGKATGEAEKKKAFDRAFNAASQIAQTDPKVKELLDIYNVEKSILDGIASERGLYGVKWAERNVSMRWTGQSQKVRSVKQRLVDAVNKAAPSGVRQGLAGVRAKKAAEAEAQRAAYFTPGNIVKGYGGHDRVLEYTPVDERGTWSVRVQRVMPKDGQWMDAPNERPRWHSTQPEAKELAAGPVVKATEAPSPVTLTVKNALDEIEKAKAKGRDAVYRELSVIRGLSSSVFNGVAHRLTGSYTSDGREWSQESLTNFLMASAANDRNTFTLERLNPETDRMEPVTFQRGETVKIAAGQRPYPTGVITGISHAERKFRVDGNDYGHDFGYAYKADFDELAQPRQEVDASLNTLEQRLNEGNAIQSEGFIRSAKEVIERNNLGDYAKDRMAQLARRAADVSKSVLDKMRAAKAEKEQADAQKRAEDQAKAAEPKPPIEMTMDEWRAVSKDFKGMIDGKRTVMRDGGMRFVTIIPSKAAESKTPTIDAHNATMAAVREGKATAEQFKASFEAVVASKEAIKAELDTMTKVQLLREGGTFVQIRYANEKKGEVVDAVYRQFVGEYALGETVSYGMGKGAYEAAIRRMVDAADDAKLAAYAVERKAAMEEAQASRAARAAAIENPQTLNDYREAINVKVREGMTRKEAFLTLTPEQRIKYDTLEAEGTREARETRKRALKTQVRAADQTTGGQIIATKHTKNGYDLFVVQLSDRLSREDYQTVLASAKKLGGWYSAFRGNGAVPGFQFKDRANADAFLALAGGDTTAAQEQVAQRRDAFEDDRSQTAVERLRAMADKLEAQAAEVEGRERKTNTARRARFASAALNAAAADKAKAKTMRNIADGIEVGKAKFLDEVRTKSQVDMLAGIVETAKGNELRAKYPSYADQEKRKGEPPTAETADFAEFPSYSAFRSDLAMLGRQLLDVDGTKKLGQRLMSVADDVTDAYLEFAKANFRDVSQFGRGDSLADFASKDEAERAIKRSGLTGKAIVLPIKRGQNRVILSPSEAIGRGVWQGDGDKRITLTVDFGNELVEAIGRRGNKANRLTVPWQFQSAYDRRKALARIGIETPSEFRSALREFIDLKEQAVANRTRELELQMVGRKADGLDFFPTSAEVADQMVEAADLSPDMAVLEPSAGMGHLADRIREAGAEPDVIEISPDRRELLEEKGYHLADVDDFMQMEPRKFFTYGDVFRAPDGTEGIMRGGNSSMGSDRVMLVGEDGRGVGAGFYNRSELVGVRHRGSESGYDRIIMNPPFSNRRDAEHVRHAYDLLKPGGRIVAIMGEGVFFGQDKKAQDFRDWLDSVGGTSEKLPAGSFMDPSLPVNTAVNARMVVIDKPADAPAFSRSNASKQGITNQAAEQIVGVITSRWANVPEVVVVESVQDPKVPAAVRRADAAQRSQGATGEPEGFWYGGKAYIVSGALNRPADVVRVLFHEVLGHYGLRGTFGADLKPILAQIATMRKSEVQAKATEYGLDMTIEADRLQAAEEVLAVMAQSNPQAGFVKRAIGAIRAWLRENIPGLENMRLTDNDIVTQFILPARRFVQQGPAARVGDGVLAMSRSAGDVTDTPAFRKWFGDSKVVDADGKSLVVYHGTGAKFNVFDIGRESKNFGAFGEVAVSRLGAFFAADKKFAAKFKPKGGKLVQAFLSLQNPADLVDGYPIGVWENLGPVLKENNLLNIPADGMWELFDKGFPGGAEFVQALKDAGYDGAKIGERDSDGNLREVFIAFRPEQIKSAIGNNGQFDPENPDIRFSRSPRELAGMATDQLKMTLTAPGKLSWWSKTVGTMYNLAERHPAFKPVFNAAQSFIDDVSYYATDAADMAPKMLPKLENWRDIAKSPISAEDNKAIEAPINEGTLLWARDESGRPVKVAELEAQAADMTADQKARRLLRNDKINEGVLKMWQGLPQEQYEKLIESRYQSQMLTPGVVWTDAELKAIWKLNDAQIGLYREVRAAIDKSLDNLAKSDLVRFVGKDGAGIKDAIMEAGSVDEAALMARDYFIGLSEAEPDRAEMLLATANGIMDRADKVERLKEQGYAPLSRFGKYTVDVVTEEGRQYFGLFESMREANQMAARMRGEFGKDAVSQGTLSDESFKLFQGITPETLELFGNMLGLSDTGDTPQDQAFQAYLKLTKNNRSAMKRLIQRKGILGYSQDVGRVLANFIYSNARQTAGALHIGDLTEAVNAIPQSQGELKDEAVRLAEYIQNPQEEAQAFRGLLFAQYLGGSIASAMVNMTQPLQVSLPYLSQFGGAGAAGKELMRAIKGIATGKKDYEPDLARALKHAEEDGTVSPQEVHQLMAQARGAGTLRSGDGTKLGDALAKGGNAWAKMSLAWGKVFGVAEQLNRRSTFIAAYRMAKAQKMADPAGFAKKAVHETQFIYSKANKMRWGRGAIGGVAMTFKSYSVSYIELLHRMATQGGPEGKRAAMLAIAVLLVMGGAGGLPFMEDAEDITDAIAQVMGYNFSTKQAKQELLQDLFGEAAGQFIERGVSGLPGVPLDVTGRLGMGNLIPGTGLFLQKNSNTRDVLEIAGPAGDLAQRVMNAGGMAVRGNLAGAALELSPKAIRDLAKGADMANTGMYRDAKGFKVIDTTAGEAGLKAIGFQPNTVAQVQESNYLMQRQKDFYNATAQNIRAKWARGLFEKDEAMVAEAREAINAWNEKNPDQRMSPNMPAIWKRVREMAKDKDQRIADTAPKAMRQQFREETARVREAL